MIEKFFTQQQTLVRMGKGLLGPHLPAITKALNEARYSTASIRLHLRAADHFGAWLQAKNIVVADVSEVTVDSYIQGLDRQRSRSTPNGRREVSVPHFLLGLNLAKPEFSAM
jgi:hypothetical protein